MDEKDWKAGYEYWEKAERLGKGLPASDVEIIRSIGRRLVELHRLKLNDATFAVEVIKVILEYEGMLTDERLAIPPHELEKIKGFLRFLQSQPTVVKNWRH